MAAGTPRADTRAEALHELAWLTATGQIGDESAGVLAAGLAHTGHTPTNLDSMIVDLGAMLLRRADAAREHGRRAAADDLKIRRLTWRLLNAPDRSPDPAAITVRTIPLGGVRAARRQTAETT